MVDGFISNYVTISVSADGATCSDQTDFSAADLEKVIQNNGARIAIVALLKGEGAFTTPLGPIPLRMDVITGGFYQRTRDQILSGAGLRESMLQHTVPALGTCLASVFPLDVLNFHPADPVPLLPLDAGAALNITGGASGPVQAPPVEMAPGTPMPGFYYGLVGGGLPPEEILPPYLQAGQYTFDNDEGGADVGPLEAGLTLPPMIVWTNQDEISQIPRDQDLTITWQPQDPVNEYVMIMGASDSTDFGITSGFICSAPAETGTFTVPATILSSLMANPPWTFEGLPPATLFVGAAPRGDVAAFEASGIDIGYFHYGNWAVKNVDYK
jgi:hypothetical protein